MGNGTDRERERERETPQGMQQFSCNVKECLKKRVSECVCVAVCVLDCVRVR